MKLFRKRIKGNNKGLSLVELVCAVAIFGVAATAIGSAMVVSAQSYSRGTYELDVQEEAQTATNIVGNLIFDAVSAKQDGNVVTIHGEGITYTITYDSANQTLKYAEGAAEGVLAENVTSFDTSLTADENDFKSDRNVKVEISIEKNGKTYNATYNTTARNGSANAVGAVEAAQILVDSSVVIEPGQPNLKLPVQVTGSATNKTFSVIDDPSGIISTTEGLNHIMISATTAAVGSYSFTIQTNAQKDGTPLDTKTVTVFIRRVSNMGGTKAVMGTEGANGSSYKMTYSYDVTKWEKVYGREYDMDYIDPRQFEFDYDITGAGPGETVADYIDNVIEQTGVNPSVSLTLKKELPNGAKIAVKCIAKHSELTNKSGITYGTVSKTLYIERPNIKMSSELNRGNDNVDVLVEHDYLQSLIDKYGDDVTKTIKIYEAVYDSASDTWIKCDYNGDGIINDSDVVLTYSEENDETNTKLRPAVSAQMHPFKDYIVQYSLSIKYVDEHGITRVWPNSVPEDLAVQSNYMMEYPLTSVHVTFMEGTTEDTAKVYDTTGPKDNISIRVDGFDMDYQPYKDHVGWIVQKKNASGVYETITVASGDFAVTTGHDDGTAVFKAKFEQPGYYRLLTVLKDFEYTGYDGSTTIMNDPLYQIGVSGSPDFGVMYFKVAVSD